MHMKARYYHCMTHTDEGHLITGDSNGTIYIWANGGNTPSNMVKHGHDVSTTDNQLKSYHLNSWSPLFFNFK